MNPPDKQPASELALSQPGGGQLAERAEQAPSLNVAAVLQAAVQGGVTSENVAVVKELVALQERMEERAAAKAFAMAFLRMRKSMPEIYADKEAKDRSGNKVYSYCSEEEITKKLDPHLMSHGLTMLFGQEEHEGRITVKVTLLHELGHQETRTFTVRAGNPNAMKDAAMCDAGGATTAWRHLMIKWFGLKSRITTENDATIVGEKIGADKIQYLREQLQEVGGTEEGILKLAGVTQFEDIGEAVYPVLVRAIEARKRNKKP